MPFKKLIAMILLGSAAATVPELLWLGAHLLHDHHHATGVAETHGKCAKVAAAVAHGHGHGEGMPEHEHEFVVSPALRHDPLRDHQAPANASVEAPDTRHRLLLSSARPWRDGIGFSGSGPPRLHLLGSLLI